jgi:CheY-like chemotaxis protein
VTPDTSSSLPLDFFLQEWSDVAGVVVDSIPPIIPTTNFELPASTRESNVLRSILGLLYHLCAVQTTQDGPVMLQERSLANGFEITLKFQMNPTFNVIFREMLSGQDPVLNPKMLEHAPDAFVTMVLTQKLAARYFIKIWMQMEVRGQASIHVIFDTSVEKNATAKESPLVLVIEDTKPIGLLMEMYLHMAGFRTLLANDGIAGVEMAQEFHPDLITLDVMMPRKDGWQVLSELKNNPLTFRIPVIIISVLKDRQVGFEQGASDYMPKPVVRENLIASARRLTSPIEAPRRSLERGLHSAVYIAAVPVLSDSLGAAFPAGTLHYCETGSAGLLEELISISPTPDLIVVDCADQFGKALSTLFRLRALDALDTVPIVVIGEKKRLDYLRVVAHEIVDGFYEPMEFSRDRVLGDFQSNPD